VSGPAPSAIRIARVYGDDDSEAGYRVLVDRLWPRGASKADAALDEWDKDVAPSAELRRWYGHAVDRFPEFERRYREELARPPASEVVDRLLATARTRAVTLLTATRDVEHSGARVLLDHLTRRATETASNPRDS
jgi:uncharacterized protein YeaO (DUF488 family)